MAGRALLTLATPKLHTQMQVALPASNDSSKTSFVKEGPPSVSKAHTPCLMLPQQCQALMHFGWKETKRSRPPLSLGDRELSLSFPRTHGGGTDFSFGVLPLVLWLKKWRHDAPTGKRHPWTLIVGAAALPRLAASILSMPSRIRNLQSSA